MRILFTITAYPPSIGGAQIHAHEIARRLQQTHHVQVLTFWDRNRTDWLLGTTLRAPSRAHSYTIDGVNVSGLYLTGSQKLSLLPNVLLYYAFKQGSIRRISRDIAHQIAATEGEFDLIHNHRIGREPLSFASYDVAQKKKVPFFLTPYHHPRWKGWWYQEYHQLYRLSDGIFALSESEKKTLIEFGVAPERIFVIGGGPILANDPRPQLFRDEYGLQQRPVILFLGQKYSYKGLDALLKAAQLTARKYTDVVFVFLGPRTKFSQRLFLNVNSPNVLEIGEVDLQTKTNALAACDIFCLPSTQESFGMVFLEAWMMEKPVIGGDIPALKELISVGEDGYIVKDDPDELAEKIIWLLNNPSQRAKMGRRGKEKTLANYSWDRVAEKMETAYRMITG